MIRHATDWRIKRLYHALYLSSSAASLAKHGDNVFGSVCPTTVTALTAELPLRDYYLPPKKLCGK